MSNQNEGWNPLGWLGEMDDKYAGALRAEGYRIQKEAGKPDDFIANARAMPLHVMGVDRNGSFADPADPRYSKAIDRGGRAAAVASRYALPGLGITAAGIALADLAGYFGGSPDQPEQGQLGLNNGEMSALGVIAAAPLLAGGIEAGINMFDGEDEDTGSQGAQLKQSQEARNKEAKANSKVAEQARKRSRPGRAAGKGVAF